MPFLSRQSFLKRAAWTAAAFGGAAFSASIQCGRGALPAKHAAFGYGPLRRDPRGLLELPDGFHYTIVSRSGERMADGRVAPGMPDAMAAFPTRGGRVLLVRNHELEHGWSLRGLIGTSAPHENLSATDRALYYDAGQSDGPPAPGGVTTVLFDPAAQRVEAQWLSLGGTVRNCAGGPTPAGSWITCEESVARPDQDPGYARDHGYAFEIRVSEKLELQHARPLTAMGRFRREAIAVDPATGIVYQSEDRPDSLIYRFVPEVPGDLQAGGRLQALALRNRPGCETANRDADPSQRLRRGIQYAVRWIDLDRPAAPNDDLRHRGHALGAARFARGEGMWYARGAVYFTATSGGPNGRGQIWCYRPATNGLELFLEPNDRAAMNMPDNISFAPNGDLLVCEDALEFDNHLLGVTPAGTIYRLARNAAGVSEFAGAVFAPDGETLFVNLQADGLTLAIRGPFAARRA